MFPVAQVLDNFFPIYNNEPVLELSRRSLFDLKNRLGSFNEIKTVEDNFNYLVLGINCESFKPEEIKVKVEKNHVYVEGFHEQKNDNSFIKREFSRKFNLPDNADKTKMKCSFTNDGILKISIPKLKKVDDDGVVSIPIDFQK